MRPLSRILLVVPLLGACAGDAPPPPAADAAPSPASAFAGDSAAPLGQADVDAAAAAALLPQGMTLTAPLHPDLPPYTFVLTQGEVAGTVHVQAEGSPAIQELPIDDAGSLPDMEAEQRILVEDLDFDGYADLGVVTAVGMANAWAEYWRFDPGSRRFVRVGSHPVFQVDAAARELRTHERGGHAGLLFTTRRYRWTGGEPVVVREVEQDLAEDGERYVRTVRERVDGELVRVSADTLTQDEAAARMEGGAP